MDPAKLKAAGFSDQEIRLAQAGFSDAEIKAAKAKPNAPAPRPTRTFGGALMEGAGNIIPQAGRWLGSRDLNPANIPQHLKGLAEIPGALTDIAGGVAQQVRELSPPEYRGTAPAMNKTSAQAVGKALVDRYGGKQQIYNTIATDPWGSALDVSTVLAPAAAVTKSTKLGNVLQAASQATNPAMIAIGGPKAAIKSAKALEAPVSHTMGAVTGTSATAIREAAKAGKAGGIKAEAFQSNIRGEADPLAAVEEAKSALSAMHQQKIANYRTDILPISSDPAVLSFSNIEKAVKDVENRGYYRGLSGSGQKVATKKEAAQAWNKINKAVKDWKSLDPAEYHTAEGMDQLKQSIGDIQQSLPYGSPARSAADAVYASIKAEITRQAPGYGKVMSDYEAASQALKDLERELSLGKKGNPGTAVRKLQSALRNNASTGWNSRTDMARTLEAAGADTMFPQLAGQALSPAFPRGLSGLGVGGASLATVLAGAANPGAIAAALIAATTSSPRLVGETAYYGGKAVSAAEKLKAKLNSSGVNSKNINNATLVGEILSRFQQQQEPEQ